MPQPSEFQLKFVQYLVGLAKEEDRGALAALRRGLGKPPGTAPEMFPIVVPWTSGLKIPDEADACFLVASLFALHPDDADGGNMGGTFARIRAQEGGEGDDSLERRFVALLNAHSDDLPRYLRHAVGLARSKEAPVNYAQLLCDISPPLWNHPRRWVQHQWARAYWGRSARADEPSDDQPETDNQ